MRRRTSCKVTKKDLKQETNTEFTENSENLGISLDINKNIFDSDEDPFESKNENSSSQSSEYQGIQPRKGQTKGKRSMKKQKKQALRRKQSAKKKKKLQNSSKYQNPQSETSQIISKVTGNINGKPVKKGRQIDKLQKNILEEKEIKMFISKNGDLHITDYELINGEENIDQSNPCNIRYIFEPKYKVSDGKGNDETIKIALTSDQIAQNHELFIELIRFYRNMWEDHAMISKILI